MGLDSYAQFKTHEYAEGKLYAANNDSVAGNDNPSQWSIDSSGRLLRAGEFSASYGPDGEVSYAKLDNREWRKTGPDSYEETNILSEGWERKKQMNEVSISIYSRFRLKQPDGSFSEVSADYLKAHQDDKDLPDNLFVTMGVELKEHDGGSRGKHSPIWIGKNWHDEVPLGPRS
jgi:hypothetical protein